MIKTIRRIILLALLTTSMAVNALTLDFFDNSDTLIGSILFPYSSLDVNGDWLTSSTSINDNDAINRNIGLRVTTYAETGDPTFVGSTFTSVTVTGTVSGTINGTIGEQASGGTITLGDAYFLYPYENGTPNFANAGATVSPLDFVFSSILDQDIFNIRDLGINVAGNFIIRDTLSPVPLPAAAWLFGSALLGFFGLSRRKNYKLN